MPGVTRDILSLAGTIARLPHFPEAGFQSAEEGGMIMKTFECGTLVPGCEWHTRAEDEAEVVRRAVEHMRDAHGETTMRESMVENIKQRVRDDKSKAA